jgi:hypothetical protein
MPIRQQCIRYKNKMKYAAITHTVMVWGKSYEITVHQKSKSVWEAVGEYMGEPIGTKDSSSLTAIKRWREATQYRGNL